MYVYVVSGIETVWGSHWMLANQCGACLDVDLYLWESKWGRGTSCDTDEVSVLTCVAAGSCFMLSPCRPHTCSWHTFCLSVCLSSPFPPLSLSLPPSLPSPPHRTFCSHHEKTSSRPLTQTIQLPHVTGSPVTWLWYVTQCSDLLVHDEWTNAVEGL